MILSDRDHYHHLELQNRAQDARAIRTGYETALQEIIDYGAPTLGDISTAKAEGAIRQKPVFDTTLMRARDLLVNFVVGNVFPSSEMGWSQMDPPIDMKGDRGLKVGLDKTMERVLSFLASSNFYEQAAVHVDSMFTLGNAVMSIDEDTSLVSYSRRFGRLNFDTIPLREVFWTSEAGNRIDFCYRSQEVSLSQLTRKFQQAIPMVERRLSEGARPTDKVELRHYVYRNEFDNPSRFALKSDSSDRSMPWVEEYVLQDRYPESIQKFGSELTPFIISRLMVVDNDTMGRGLGHISRPDTKAVNFTGRLTWLGIDRDIRRPLITWDKGHLPLSRPGAKATAKPGYPKPEFLDPGVDILKANEVRRQDQQSIMQIWGADAFVDPETQPRSAEESIQRRQRNLQRHAKHSQRVAGDFLDPVLTTVIHRLLKAGELPELEEQQDRLEGKELPFRYTSPFFRAQMQSQLESALALVERRSILTKETGMEHWFDDLDLDFIRTMEREIGGVPEQAFKTQEAIDMVREARGQKAALEQSALLEAGARAGRPRSALPSPGGVPIG